MLSLFGHEVISLALERSREEADSASGDEHDNVAAQVELADEPRIGFRVGTNPSLAPAEET